MLRLLALLAAAAAALPVLLRDPLLSLLLLPLPSSPPSCCFISLAASTLSNSLARPAALSRLLLRALELLNDRSNLPDAASPPAPPPSSPPSPSKASSISNDRSLETLLALLLSLAALAFCSACSISLSSSCTRSLERERALSDRRCCIDRTEADADALSPSSSLDMLLPSLDLDRRRSPRRLSRDLLLASRDLLLALLRSRAASALASASASAAAAASSLSRSLALPE
mmetsp:Transcript_10251/g.22198  ORF Transcript_10251/g.22198 Transcript_10251/m.22198 type:complete len:229 (+) Transcript_10251:2605-3291(+)